jgi:fructan beta-fructosidase
MDYLKDFWHTVGRTFAVFILGTAAAVFSCQATNPPFVIKHLGEGQSIVQIESPKKFLLLPVEESSPEAKLYMIADNDVVRSMNVRLAIRKIDYFIPVDLSLNLCFKRF